MMRMISTFDKNYHIAKKADGLVSYAAELGPFCH